MMNKSIYYSCSYCRIIKDFTHFYVQNAIKKYDPTVIGYELDNENPQIQLEPRGERGYIELKAIKRKK